MTVKKAIVTEVNSGMITLDNLNKDNGFLEPEYTEMIKKIREYGIDPIGISFRIPYNPHRSEQIAFVYKKNDEIYWCHFPKVCWENFVHKVYGINYEQLQHG